MPDIEQKHRTPGKAGRLGPALGSDIAPDRSLSAMRTEAEGCERCDLYRHATHLVFGEGPRDARVVLVGEQPGDREDIAGRPFVGPAGRLLDECLHEAGVDRSLLYLTNSVKHFKFVPRGKKRLHSKPNAGEIQRCAWWLGGELNLIKPDLVVTLGATALYSLLGNKVKVTKSRGAILEVPNGYAILVTIHPSSLLRIPDRAAAEKSRSTFVEELRKIAPFLSETIAH
jgi:uracil-DNA glycosylase family protein